MRLASLSMYVSPPPVARAQEEFWAFLQDWLRQAGLADVPERLDRSVAYDAAWHDPGLLLAQSCGYPYAKSLRGVVRLVATPVYDRPGCEGPLMCSLLIARRDSAGARLADFRGKVAALNAYDSNSGANLFRASVASLAGGERFFASVVETGSHAASIDAVAAGLADIAAIDCVTYGNFSAHAPERVSGLTIIGETPKGPGLPFVTRASASDEEVEMLRQALAAAIVAPGLAPARAALALKGFAVLDDAAYQGLLDMEKAAEAAAYPVIA
ncbi:PhnD/SsuA/transferrin family substrate-binding protein [Rhizobium sp. LjRoot30]|uniref:phosphate/phosphite/phosphonate ABC transporter substrate-binding protein n=1 Tax=Rhizobium sp. LjRoot30 TaxID=3342320 RepID=UPI003ED14004